MKALLVEPDEYQQPEEDPEPYRTEDGEEDEYDHRGEPEGMEISRVRFRDLKKKLPVRLFLSAFFASFASSSLRAC